MSQYETLNLAIAQKQYCITVIYTLITAMGVLVAGGAGYFVFGQLRSARWMTLLTLEQDMAGRRDKFLDIQRRLRSGDNSQNLADEFKVQKESYLNSVERLASSVLNGNFPQKEIKQDYRDYIAGVVKAFPEDFQAATSYRKTLKLYNRWQD